MESYKDAKRDSHFCREHKRKAGLQFVASPAPEVCTSCKLYQACMSRLKRAGLTRWSR
jgi:uncharacterized protein (UPF0179 family)